MKKTLLISLISLFAVSTVFAQRRQHVGRAERGERVVRSVADSVRNGKRDCVRVSSGPYIASKLWQNWFITAGAGGHVYMGDYDSNRSISKRIGGTAFVGVGKWFTTVMGVRGVFSIAKMKGALPDRARIDSDGKVDLNGTFHTYGDPDADGFWNEKFNYFNLRGEFLVNFSSFIGGYKPKRFYEVIGYIGAGYLCQFKSHSDDNNEEELSVNVGIINKFRVSDRFDINLEFAGMMTSQRFDGVYNWTNGTHGGGSNNGLEGAISATLGVTYKLGKKSSLAFKRPCVASVCNYNSYKNRISELENTINDLNADKKKLTADLEDCNKKLNDCETKETTTVVVEKPTKEEMDFIRQQFQSVYFDLNKDNIKPVSFANLDNVVEILRKYPKATVRLGGHTDSTGSVAYNMNLSQRRADAVKRYFQDHGVTSNIEATGYGPTVPIASNATVEGRAQNRRTEIEVY